MNHRLHRLNRFLTASNLCNSNSNFPDLRMQEKKNPSNPSNLWFDKDNCVHLLNNNNKNSRSLRLRLEKHYARKSL